MKKIILLIVLFLIPLSSFAKIEMDFVDVATSRPDYPYIHDLLKKWIIDSGQVFRPDAQLTRAEFSKIIVLWTLWVANDKIKWYNSFSDIDTNEWYYPYIQSARYYNFLNWYEDWLFRPWRQINRAEAIKIIILSSGLAEKKSNRKYVDLDWKQWYEKYAYSAFEYGIYEWERFENWNKKMVFNAGHLITRWEMATMFSKALSKSEFY